MNEFENAIVEAETLLGVYEAIAPIIEENKEDLQWYKEQYKSCQKTGKTVDEWIEKGMAIEVKRKQVLLTVVSKLHEQLWERG